MEEINLSLLRPGQIRARIARTPVVFVPIGPLEWHGPHCPYGTDGLNAQNVATEVCRAVGGVLWPTLFWGTERERRPDQLLSLGFEPDRYIVGMEFPANSLPSCYCPEEVLAILVREVVREAGRIGARLVVIINGHGAENHIAMLRRLAVEITNTTGPRVHVRISAPQETIDAGSGGHADAGETSVMMFLTRSVDLSTLPPLPQALAFTDFAVVNGGGFDGKAPDHVLPHEADPRRNSSRDRGRRITRGTVREIQREVEVLLSGLSRSAKKPGRRKRGRSK
jgi:creatinine amidohydrolase